MKTIWLGRLAAIAGIVLLATSLTARPASAQTATEARVEALEEQLNAVLQQLQAVQEELAATRAAAAAASSTAAAASSTAAAASSTAAQAQEKAEELEQAQQETQEQLPDGPLVTSGDERIKLAISGHVNRAFNIVDDSENAEVFFVDNDVSNTRFRLVGTGDMGDGWTLGTRIELGFSPNNSFDVNQRNEDSGDFFDQRKAEVFVRNDKFGQILFGKGDSASEDTSEYDLSLIAGPMMYSGVADLYGGIIFRDNKTLTGVTVGDAFFNFDGLGRTNRARVDSPVFGPGVQVSASASSNDRYDVAVTWGGDYQDWTGVEIGDFLTLGAVAFSDPNQSRTDYRVNGSFSTLHQPTGLSLTVSAGAEDRDENNAYNIYSKVAWDTNFFDLGDTGFGVDFTRGEDICGTCDAGHSVGVGAIQLVDAWGLEIYSQFRWFTLDTDSDADGADDIYAFTLGSRAKF